MSIDDDRNSDDENEASEIIASSDTEEPEKHPRITMEVPLFLVMLGISLSVIPIYNILLYRTCVHSLNYDKEQCKGFLQPDRTNATLELEGEVQKYVAYISMVKTIIESIAPASLAFFIGAWSDTHGRKPVVVWPLLGITISTMLFVVYSMLDDLGPWWLIVAGIPYSLTGGFMVLITGAYCYVSDITTQENRSLRIMIVDGSFGGGSMLGSFISSQLLRSVGNVNLLLIVTAIYVSAYVFTNLFLKESLPGAVKGGIRSLFKPRLAKEMVTECLKPRPNNLRAQILLLAAANTLLMFIGYGTYNLEYLYTRQKLHWAMKDYTFYSGITTLIGFVGGFVGIVVLQRFLALSDVVVAVVALVSSVADCVIKTLAVLSWHMYLGSTISLIKGLSPSLIKSFLSKILPREDTAKMFALLCVLDAFCPLVSPVVYNSLYSSTVTTFPGAFYVLSAGIFATSAVLLGFVQFYRWRSGAYQRLPLPLQ